MRQSASAQSGKIWRVALGTRIGIGLLAAFMFGTAAVMFSIQYIAGTPDHSGDWIVYLGGVVVAGFGCLGTFALIAITRTRITLDATTLAGTVVAGHDWLLVPRFRSFSLPLSGIRSVERRSEIFRSLGVSTMRDALSIVTASGERIGLFSNTLGSVETLPVDEVGEAIAAAAGIALTDDGTVRTHGSGLFGAASSAWTERPLDVTSASKARRAVYLTAQISSALLLLTFVLRSCF